jgi:hypothetical protein
MEKKRYEELELKTVRFDAEDVITTSADTITCERVHGGCGMDEIVCPSVVCTADFF